MKLFQNWARGLGGVIPFDSMIVTNANLYFHNYFTVYSNIQPTVFSLTFDNELKCVLSCRIFFFGSSLTQLSEERGDVCGYSQIIFYMLG